MKVERHEKVEGKHGLYCLFIKTEYFLNRKDQPEWFYCILFNKDDNPIYMESGGVIPGIDDPRERMKNIMYEYEVKLEPINEFWTLKAE